MGKQDSFTELVNYRKLASQLRTDGHTTVPERDELLKSAKTAGGVQLVEWVMDHLERDEGNFHGILAFHFQEVGENDD